MYGMCVLRALATLVLSALTKSSHFQVTLIFFFKGAGIFDRSVLFSANKLFPKSCSVFLTCKVSFLRGEGLLSTFFSFFKTRKYVSVFLKKSPCHHTFNKHTSIHFLFLNSNARSLVHFFHFFRNITAL